MADFPPPLRSALFVPAASSRALEKSRSLPADALIFDLEDSAAPGEKAKARERLAGHLASREGRALRAVRINRLDEGGRQDIEGLRGALIDAVLLPKVESADELRELDKALDEAGLGRSVGLWAMVETPRGIQRAQEIADAAPSRPVGALVVGPNDIVLATGIRVSPGRPELVPWLMQIVLAGKAAGVPVLDGVYNDFRDAEGLSSQCDQGRSLGFSGKTLIHPNQIGPANAAFSPSAQEVAEAERIVAAFAQPENEGKGVVNLDGRMVERLHLTQATRLLALRHAMGETA